jgi:hypothetical protein
MKKLFFVLVSSLCFCILHAQEKTTPFDPKNYLEQKKGKTNPVYDWSLKNKVTDEQFKKLLEPGFSITISGNTYNLSNGNKVIILLQDNMPCMVPDMKQFNMPVLKVEVPNTMPNAIGMNQKSRSEIIAKAKRKQ